MQPRPPRGEGSSGEARPAPRGRGASATSAENGSWSSSGETPAMAPPHKVRILIPAHSPASLPHSLCRPGPPSSTVTSGRTTPHERVPLDFIRNSSLAPHAGGPLANCAESPPAAFLGPTLRSSASSGPTSRRLSPGPKEMGLASSGAGLAASPEARLNPILFSFFPVANYPFP